MAKSQYNLIWKEGSFFEKGHWKLVPKADANGGAIGWIITIGLVAFIAFCLILTLPLWISLLGFSMVKSKRHYAGIGSIIALLYFILDVQKKWISGFLFYGYNSSNGSFNEGIFGEKFAVWFYVINGIGVLIALFFISESELFDNSDTSNDLSSYDTGLNGKKILFITIGIIAFGFGIYSIKDKNQNKPKLNKLNVNKLDKLNVNIKAINNQISDDEYEVDFDYAYSKNNNPQKAKLIADKSYFYLTPDFKNKTPFHFKLISKDIDMFVNYDERKNGFIHVYSDNYKDLDDGWLLESDFEIINESNDPNESSTSANDTLSGVSNNSSANINDDIPETNENPNQGVFTVNTDKCFFYLTPTSESKLKAYLVAGQRGTYLAVKDGFVYTVFTNSNGVTSKGWLQISEISISN